MRKYPLIIVCAPTAKAKNYCFEEWLANVMSFTYPNFIVRLFDNTNDGGNNAKHLNAIFTQNYGPEKEDEILKFKAFNSLQYNKVKNTSGVVESMCISHNDCIDMAKQVGVNFILHLETDVFPPRDVIERLLWSRKMVCGAVYYRDEGIARKPMLQTRLFRSPNNIGSMNLNTLEEINTLDGTVKEFASVGLGCVLIHVPIFEKIGKFRFDKKRPDTHPDTFFSEDCFKHGINIFADTSIICRHDNRRWY